MAKRPKTIADVEKKIAQWQTRFRRAMNAISKLNAQHKRMVKAAQQAAQPPVTMIAIAAPERKVFEPDNVAGYHPGQSDAERTKRGAKLREEMQRKKAVKTKRAPLSTPPATA